MPNGGSHGVDRRCRPLVNEFQTGLARDLGPSPWLMGNFKDDIFEFHHCSLSKRSLSQYPFIRPRAKVVEWSPSPCVQPFRFESTIPRKEQGASVSIGCGVSWRFEELGSGELWVKIY
jgi:hypothetical protein